MLESLQQIEALQSKQVFHFFEEICSMPHGSYNIDRISDYLYRFGKERNLEVYQDDLKNVIIIKEATKGMEEKQPIILQGHMDMVAVKTENCRKNMETDGLDLAVDGDYLYAKETSLGADDGIAVAYALALLDSTDIPHPRLEVVITVNEEVGMDGAIGIDLSMLKGKKLLNIDSEKEGELTVACAGGTCITAGFKPAWNEVEGKKYKLSLAGLSGGHSGVEIHKKSGNANKILMNVLYLMAREVDMTIYSFAGGTKDNVIPSSAVCEFVSRAETEMLTGLVEVMQETLQQEWSGTDPNLSLTVEQVDEKEISKAAAGKLIEQKGMNGNDFFDLLKFFLDVPNGVQKMDPNLDGLVQTSLNLGVLKIENNGPAKATFSLRSSVIREREELAQSVIERIEEYGGKASVSGTYPAWEYREDSPLREQMLAVYKQMFGTDMTVLSIHAGLECGILSEKIDDLDCVSFGPDILDIHSTKERLSISSVERMWRFVLEVLKSE